jgi:hypothetical protein
MPVFTTAGKLRVVALALCCTFAAAHAQRRSCAAIEPASLTLRLGTLPVQQAGGAVLFHAGLYVDADGAPNAYAPNNKGLDFTANAKTGGRFSSIVLNGDGKPVLQRSGRYKGFFVSTTSLRSTGSPSSPGTYVNAVKVPYFVLPPEFIDQFHVTLGDLALVTNTENGRSAFAILADVGPHGKIGEGSIALAHALGLNSDPRNGGTSRPIMTYLVFPGSGLGQGRLRTARQIKTSGVKAFHQWGGARRLQACSTLN